MRKAAKPRVRFILVGIIAFLSFSLCPAQNSYQEIEIYRSWLEKESRDSAYHKALAEYKVSKAPPRAPVSRLEKQLAQLLSLPENSETEVTRKREALERLAREAYHQKEWETELTSLSEAFTMAFWRETGNNSRAFLIAARMEKRIASVNETLFPGLRRAYVKLGEAYFICRDFPKSIELLENIIDKVPSSFEDVSHLEALRLSGMCYASTPGMMKRSDSCFMAMMRCPDVVFNRPVYNALALSNLSSNSLNKGDFDKALALDLEVLDRLKAEKYYGHIAGMYACQGFVYYARGDYAQLRAVIDSIATNARKDNYNRRRRLKQAYSLSAKYYSVTGDARAAQLYNDSLIALYKAEERENTPRYISNAYRVVKEREIEVQQLELARQKQFLVMSLLLATAFFVFLSVILWLYRREHAAYRALVRKNQEWANSIHEKGGQFILNHLVRGEGDKERLTPEGIDLPSENVSKEDLVIMSRIFSHVVGKKQYTSPGFNLEELSEQISINRKYLSRAINNTTGKNFNTYVNEYRVKEAIRLLSDPENRYLSVDNIGEQVGFSSRSSFYESFHKLAGITPSQFKKTRKSMS